MKVKNKTNKKLKSETVKANMMQLFVYLNKYFGAHTMGLWGFPGSSAGKESACNLGDLGSKPGWGRSPVRGHGNPLQYSCLENSMDRGAWWATVHGVTKSQI